MQNRAASKAGAFVLAGAILAGCHGTIGSSATPGIQTSSMTRNVTVRQSLVATTSTTPIVRGTYTGTITKGGQTGPATVKFTQSGSHIGGTFTFTLQGNTPVLDVENASATASGGTDYIFFDLLNPKDGCVGHAQATLRKGTDLHGSIKIPSCFGSKPAFATFTATKTS